MMNMLSKTASSLDNWIYPAFDTGVNAINTGCGYAKTKAGNLAELANNTPSFGAAFARTFFSNAWISGNNFENAEKVLQPITQIVMEGEVPQANLVAQKIIPIEDKRSKGEINGASAAYKVVGFGQFVLPIAMSAAVYADRSYKTGYTMQLLKSPFIAPGKLVEGAEFVASKAWEASKNEKIQWAVKGAVTRLPSLVTGYACMHQYTKLSDAFKSPGATIPEKIKRGAKIAVHGVTTVTSGALTIAGFTGGTESQLGVITGFVEKTSYIAETGKRLLTPVANAIATVATPIVNAVKEDPRGATICAGIGTTMTFGAVAYQKGLNKQGLAWGAAAAVTGLATLAFGYYTLPVNPEPAKSKAQTQASKPTGMGYHNVPPPFPTPEPNKAQGECWERQPTQPQKSWPNATCTSGVCFASQSPAS